MGLHWPASRFPIHPTAFQLHQFAVPFASRACEIERAGNDFIPVFAGKLLVRSEIVYSIPPSLTTIRSRRGRKNDVVDAENVGRALLANPQLTPLHNTGQQRELQELTRAQ